jgi:hypothetical protein
MRVLLLRHSFIRHHDHCRCAAEPTALHCVRVTGDDDDAIIYHHMQHNTQHNTSHNTQTPPATTIIIT